MRPRRGNTGHCWDCSPGRGPLPSSVPPPPRAQRTPPAGTDCGTVPTAQHRSPPCTIGAPLPRTSPPCISRGRCATSPSQTAPRGGQVERAGCGSCVPRSRLLPPPPQRAPQRHPGVSVPTSPGEIGARRRGPHIPVASSPPPPGLPVLCQGSPVVPPPPPSSQGQLSVSRQAEPGSSCRAQQSGGGLCYPTTRWNQVKWGRGLPTHTAPSPGSQSPTHRGTRRGAP